MLVKCAAYITIITFCFSLIKYFVVCSIINENNFRTDLDVHRSKGYTIFNENGELKRSSSYLFKDNGPLYLAFGNIADWRGIANELWPLPLFSNSMNM